VAGAAQQLVGVAVRLEEGRRARLARRAGVACAFHEEKF
jgi:hypothetical protein